MWQKKAKKKKEISFDLYAACVLAGEPESSSPASLFVNTYFIGRKASQTRRRSTLVGAATCDASVMGIDGHAENKKTDAHFHLRLLAVRPPKKEATAACCTNSDQVRYRFSLASNTPLPTCVGESVCLRGPRSEIGAPED